MNKNKNNNYILYFLFVLIFIMDLFVGFGSKRTMHCLRKADSIKKTKILSTLIFHHIISVFAHYGWLLPNKPLLILFIFSCLFAISNWQYTGGYCQITKYANELCGDEEPYFHDILWKIGVKDIQGLHDRLILLFLIFGIAHYLSLN